MSIKEVIGSISVIPSITGSLYYIYTVFTGETKPHAFSWLIWAILTGIGFAAQVYEKGGAGSWIMAVACIESLIVFILSLKRGEKKITLLDWSFLIASLSAIPLWIITRQPLPSVILVTLIDSLGYGPTFRKSYTRPNDETLWLYATGAISFLLGILALEHYSPVTWLYPAASAFMNISLITMILIRRYQLKSN
jgi:hypothetical protein